jgi:sugar fermentation stimulation protein A
MKFDPPLEPAKFVRRYKRFFAEMELADGSIETAHCPNTGSMRNCLVEGSLCYFSRSDNPKRKLKTSLEYVTCTTGRLACVNTQRANQIVKEALNQGKISELSDYQDIASEVKYGEENSRIDFKLTNPKSEAASVNRAECFVEVKSVTLAEGNIASFPDAVTLRGQKHLRELMAMREAGHRAVLFFSVQHQEIDKVSVATEIDPEYAKLFKLAIETGVEVLAYQCLVTADELVIHHSIPFNL